MSIKDENEMLKRDAAARWIEKHTRAFRKKIGARATKR